MQGTVSSKCIMPLEKIQKTGSLRNLLLFLTIGKCHSIYNQYADTDTYKRCKVFQSGNLLAQDNRRQKYPAYRHDVSEYCNLTYGIIFQQYRPDAERDSRKHGHVYEKGSRFSVKSLDMTARHKSCRHDDEASEQ